MSVNAIQRGCQVPWSQVISELPDVDVGNWTQVLLKRDVWSKPLG